MVFGEGVGVMKGRRARPPTGLAQSNECKYLMIHVYIIFKLSDILFRFTFYKFLQMGGRL